MAANHHNAPDPVQQDQLNPHPSIVPFCQVSVHREIGFLRLMNQDGVGQRA